MNYMLLVVYINSIIIVFIYYKDDRQLKRFSSSLYTRGINGYIYGFNRVNMLHIIIHLVLIEY